MQGRKPKPTALKKLQGTYRPDRASSDEPHPPVPDGVPYVPRHLNAKAKAEWRRIVGILLELGLYTEFDRAALAIYCQAWGRWVIAEQRLQEQGEMLTAANGYVYQNPWRYEANKAQAEMRKAFGDFGFTPADRARLKVDAPEHEPSLADQLSALIGTSVVVGDDD